MTTINYEKYKFMSYSELAKNLENAIKRKENVISKYEKKIKEELSSLNHLISFLNSQLQRDLQKDFLTLEETNFIFNRAKKWAEENPEEAEKVKQEYEQEKLKNYDEED